jgi:hypothetical protein
MLAGNVPWVPLERECDQARRANSETS